MSCTCNNSGTCLDCCLSEALKNDQLAKTHAFGMNLAPMVRESLCDQCGEKSSCPDPCRQFLADLKKLAGIAFAGMAAEN